MAAVINTSAKNFTGTEYLNIGKAREISNAHAPFARTVSLMIFLMIYRASLSFIMLGTFTGFFLNG